MELPDDLLDRLDRGEVEAAEVLFEVFTPYLRAVVRRQLSDRLRAEFDSDDVVQSVWVQVVRQLAKDGWKADSADRLRGLLATIARRRVVTRVRKHARSAAQERPDGGGWADVPEANRPRPSEVAQAGELWDDMLRLCPPEHHAILTLRREGLPLEEIAARTGLHEGSVRRVLRRLSREVALRQQPLAYGTPDEDGPAHDDLP